MAGLLDYTNEFLKGGKKYRDALGGLLTGNASGASGLLGEVKQLFDPTYTSQIQSTAMQDGRDAGMMLATTSGSLKNIPELNSLNPTGGLYVGYTPELRAKASLGDRMTTLDKTMGGSPDDLITIYRGAPKNQKGIVAGDFITDMPELAASYTDVRGGGKVLKMVVKRGDILDDIHEPLGNEYLYRPNAHKELFK